MLYPTRRLRRPSLAPWGKQTAEVEELQGSVRLLEGTDVARQNEIEALQCELLATKKHFNQIQESSDKLRDSSHEEAERLRHSVAELEAELERAHRSVFA